MRLKNTVVVLSVFSFGKYRILTYTENYQRSFEVARATYMYPCDSLSQQRGI